MMLDPNALKKAMITVGITIFVYTATVFGLGYWLGSYDSEPARVQQDKSSD